MLMQAPGRPSSAGWAGNAGNDAFCTSRSWEVILSIPSCRTTLLAMVMVILTRVEHDASDYDIVPSRGKSQSAGFMVCLLVLMD